MLSQHMEVYRAPQGGTLFLQGEREHFMCLLIQGEVQVLKEDSQGQPPVLATLGPHKTLGEMALIDHQPRSATARVSAAVEMFVLTQESLAALAAQHPRVYAAFLQKVARQMSERLRHTSGELVDYLGQV